jgi:hypothetical protein
MARARPQDGLPAVRPPQAAGALSAAPSRPALLLALLLAATATAATAPPVGPAAAAEPDTVTILTEHEFHLMPAGLRALPLAHGFVVPGSLRLLVDGQVWREERDFHLRARSGLVVPLRGWRAAAPDSGARRAAAPGADLAIVSATYRCLPVPLAARLDLREVAPTPAPGGVGGPAGAGGAAGAAGGDAAANGGVAWRDANLRVSGSKTVQVSSGSRREMTVDQNLRLNIAGQLTPEIAVRAMLSDDNLPVVPEGNTEELKDIDKVSVEITAPDWKATLGDLVVQRQGTAFGDVRRKLQGLDVRVAAGQGGVEAVAGAPRGTYRSLQFQGQEANQGPYRLAGGEGGANLFLVAGSERVRLDGEPMVRGADRDYVVDYVLGTITFTYRRLITAESLIAVEYEQGEGPYSRTALGAGADGALRLPTGGPAAHWRARVYREKDDPSRLRTGDLAAGDQAALAAAGDDAALAVAPGATAVAAGAGAYTVQVTGADTVYVHAPEGGDWDVVFFYAGSGAGDYTLDHLTAAGQRVFLHVGAGLGSWRVGRQLARPGSHSLATFGLDLGDPARTGLTAEWDASQVDANLLSTRDDGDNAGTAGRIAGRLGGDDVRLGGRRLGALSLQGTWEERGPRFAPLQLRRTVADYEAWGVADRARRAGFLDQSDRQADAAAGWQAAGRRGRLDLALRLGSLRHAAALTADRRAATAQWSLGAVSGRSEVTGADARDTVEPLDVARRTQRHELSWRVAALQPGASWEKREWRDAAAPAGRAAGFRFAETGFVLAGAGGGGATWRADFRRGLADSLKDGGWRLERDSRTATASVSGGVGGGMRVVGEGTVRRVERPAGTAETTRLARVDLSGRWERSLSDWSLGYRVDNSRTEVLDRQILFVGDRQGDFNENGDYVGIDQGDYDVVVAGTDSLVATTAVRGDVRWRQGFGFLGRERWYGAWSALTVASLEGRSTTDDVGRLLRLDPAAIFDGDAAVLGDLDFSEEVAFLEHEPRYDLRGRVGYRQTRDRQYAAHPEDRLDRRWQLTGTMNLTSRTTLRARWAQEGQRRESAEAAASARRSQDLAVRRLELGWQLSPGPELRLGVQGERVWRDDEVSAVGQDEWALRPSARARLRGGWSALLDARLSSVSSREPAGALRPIAFPYAGGNVESTLRLSWEPTQFLTVSLSWFGRRQGERGWQHDLRLESTARF